MAAPAARSAGRRPALLAPIDAVLSRMPTSARLMLLVVLLVVPAALANAAFARTITASLDFSRAERDGVTVLRPALTAMAATAAGRDPDLAAVRSAVVAQPDLELTTNWQAVDKAATALTAAGSDDAAAGTARAGLVSALADLVTQAGNTSNLILDPDLDSFYVMDALVVQVPRMLVTAVQAGAPDSAAARTERVAAQAVQAGAIASASTAVTADLRTAIANTSDGALAGRLKSLEALTTGGQALADRLTSTLASPADADPSAVGAAAATAVPDAVSALDALLETRTGRLARERSVTLAVTLAALAVAGWFAAGVWWRTRRDVTLVLDAVTAIAEDDLTPRVVPEGREEFGSIGRALAVARHQLDEARTALSLSQAAREEQMKANFAQRQAAEHQARERAQEVIDATAGTVVGELGDVVNQVDAVRVAASTIDSRVTAADAATRSVVDQAHEADRLVTALSGSLDQVAGMAALIAGIADQTRLLALNATIESARAGEAGRGFSVVAQEVKNLAVTTATSTTQITQTIASLRQDADAVATAITMMSQGIAGVDEATAVLSDVATEQHALVDRVDRCVTEAMERVHGMAQLTEKLERRRHDRVPTVGEVTLRFGGKVLEARLADISLGGIRCLVDAVGAPREGDLAQVDIQLSDGPVVVLAQVVRAAGRGEDVQLGLEFGDLDTDIVRRIAGFVSTLSPRFHATTS